MLQLPAAKLCCRYNGSGGLPSRRLRDEGLEQGAAGDDLGGGHQDVALGFGA